MRSQKTKSRNLQNNLKSNWKQPKIFGNKTPKNQNKPRVTIDL